MNMNQPRYVHIEHVGIAVRRQDLSGLVDGMVYLYSGATAVLEPQLLDMLTISLRLWMVRFFKPLASKCFLECPTLA